MRTRSDVDDIVSEVFTRAWSCKDWSRIDKGRAYLFEVARNLVIDFARREKIISYDTVVDIDLLDSGYSLELSSMQETKSVSTIEKHLAKGIRLLTQALEADGVNGFVERRISGSVEGCNRTEGGRAGSRADR